MPSRVQFSENGTEWAGVAVNGGPGAILFGRSDDGGLRVRLVFHYPVEPTSEVTFQTDTESCLTFEGGFPGGDGQAVIDWLSENWEKLGDAQ